MNSANNAASRKHNVERFCPGVDEDWTLIDRDLESEAQARQFIAPYRKINPRAQFRAVPA